MRISHIALAALALIAASTVQAAPKIGEPAPMFALNDSEGRTHRLSDYKDKYVVLEWTNHECPFVQKHYESGNMQSLQKQVTAQGAVWLSIISSAPGKQGHVDGARADELTKLRSAKPSAVLLDPKGEVGREYEAKTTPHMFVIAPLGKLIYMGGIDSVPSADPADVAGATPYVKLALSEAMAGRPVSNPSTRPYGCSVKY